MTLLSIVQDAADEIGIIQPVSVATNQDPDAQKLFRLANKVGNGLMKLYAWQVLTSEQTFTALNQSEQTAILPSDFDRFIPESFWDRSNSRLITGPITERQWQGLQAGSYSNSSERKFIYRGGTINVIPIFGGGETLAFSYVSKNWATDSGGTAQAKFFADTDLTLFDEDLFTAGLVYEYLKSEGLPMESAMREFNDHFDRLISNDQPTVKVLVSGDIFGRGGRHYDGVPRAATSGLLDYY